MHKIGCWKAEIKPYHALKTAGFILLGAVISTGTIPVKNTFISLLIAMLTLVSVRITTCALSHKEDLEKKKKTPITEKKTTEKESKQLAIALFLISSVGTYTLLNIKCLILLIITHLIAVIYARFKYKYPLKSAREGIYTGMAILFAGFANSPKSEGVTTLIIALATLMTLTITARNIAKNIPTKKKDMYKKDTVAEKYDSRTAAIVSSSLIIAAIFISIIPIASFGTTVLYMIGTTDIILAYAGLRMLISTEHTTESARFMKIAIILIIATFMLAAI